MRCTAGRKAGSHLLSRVSVAGCRSRLAQLHRFPGIPLRRRLPFWGINRVFVEGITPDPACRPKPVWPPQPRRCGHSGAPSRKWVDLQIRPIAGPHARSGLQHRHDLCGTLHRSNAHLPSFLQMLSLDCGGSWSRRCSTMLFLARRIVASFESTSSRNDHSYRRTGAAVAPFA